ncbi:MAG: Tex family protein [Thiohalospira sp.]
MARRIIETIADELDVSPRQVGAAVDLLDGGATVPFVARYRKEATGGLDDTQLRRLEERLTQLRELEKRRESILASLDEQGVTNPSLRAAIQAAETRTRLEDLYRPYARKKRTRAQIAKEAGLEPLADELLEAPDEADPETLAADYINTEAGFGDAATVLAGARDILVQRMADDADLAARLREEMDKRGRVVPSAGEEAERDTRFTDYIDRPERVRDLPAHRILALLRGREAGALRLALVHERDVDAPDGSPDHCEAIIAAHWGLGHATGPCAPWLRQTVRRAWRVKIASRVETEIFRQLREKAEEEAVRVFATNLRNLLLAPPAGARPVLALDPGLRTGTKVAVLDAAGGVAATTTIYPHAPQKQWEESLQTLAGLVADHGVELVAVGNGTAARETEQLADELTGRCRGLTRVMVSEDGASVYSASEEASRELPDLDVSLRGAVSIGRRLQDPLAELVKIEPGHIGVGQYQHDVSQSRLASTLEGVVEDCVNAVGVDVNTASPALLSRVSGLGPALAEAVVNHRTEKGPFRSRAELQSVPRLGPVAFEQAAGFLRIRDGEEPLDASAVHPEAYPVVERLLERLGRGVNDVMGDADALRRLDPRQFTDDRFGVPTVTDILAELEKPGRDPRGDFRTARFREDVTRPSDLQPGMALEGVVTNVTDFGAFVDVGVHQDDLVHISKLSREFVRDPHAVVKVGDVVHAHVLEVDLERGRIGLSLCGPEPDKGGDNGPAKERRGGKPKQPREEKPRGAMAAALAALRVRN